MLHLQVWTQGGREVGREGRRRQLLCNERQITRAKADGLWKTAQHMEKRPAKTTTTTTKATAAYYELFLIALNLLAAKKKIKQIMLQRL